MLRHPRFDIAISFGGMAADFGERIGCRVRERLTDMGDVLSDALGCFHAISQFGEHDGREIDEVILGKRPRPRVDRTIIGTAWIEQDGDEICVEENLLH